MIFENILNSNNFFLVTLILFLAITFRYFIIAGLFSLFFAKIQPLKWQERIVNRSAYKQNQFFHEIKWSLLTSVIFAVVGALVIALWRGGFTAIYSDLEGYGLSYFFVSIFLVMLMHETYYYWLHRWMHLPKIFLLIHKVHHTSIVTSPWTAFAFHPWEALIQALFLLLLVTIVPLNVWALVIYISIMSISSVINHLNVEICPREVLESQIGRCLVSATHHSFHHRKLKYNFGLYFTFWDQWMGTESPLTFDPAPATSEGNQQSIPSPGCDPLSH
jgi:Delta7-sterol 5-desaturase